MHCTNNVEGRILIQQGKPNAVEEANSSKALNEGQILSTQPEEKSSREGQSSSTQQEESNDNQAEQKVEKANDS